MDCFTFKDNTVVMDAPPKHPKKLTATRFASVLGLNAWNTPFQTWCEITKVYSKPFEDTIYTKAGKVIEPKIIKYLQDVYFMDIKSPTDVFGKDYFKETRGDFYQNESKVFGGMWDAKSDDCIVEIKTTKRAEDWLDGVPVYYKLQAALYAWLSNVDSVRMVCAFLTEEDYEHPENFKPTSKNTIIRDFTMEEEYPNFYQEFIKPAYEWWEKHVLSGVSPAFNEKADAEYLKALRTNVIDGDASLDALLLEIDKGQAEYDALKASADKVGKVLTEQKKALKDYMMKKFGKNDTKVDVSSKHFTFTVTKSMKSVFDEETFKKENADIYKKYQSEKPSYTLTKSKRKDEK